MNIYAERIPLLHTDDEIFFEAKKEKLPSELF